MPTAATILNLAILAETLDTLLTRFDAGHTGELIYDELNVIPLAFRPWGGS